MIGVSAFAYLRVLGFIVAAGMFAIAVLRWRRRRLRLTDALIMGTLAVALAVLAADPDLIQPFLNFLGFKAGNSRRVIGVLVISNILVYILILRSYAKTDRLEDLLGEYADRLATRHFVSENGERIPLADMTKLAVVIPALNEERSLPKVLAEIPARVEGLEVEVLVVSDGSTDATEAVAREHGALVVGRDLRRGQGAAVALGYRVALIRGADVVATLDADGQ